MIFQKGREILFSFPPPGGLCSTTHFSFFIIFYFYLSGLFSIYKFFYKNLIKNMALANVTETLRGLLTPPKIDTPISRVANRYSGAMVQGLKSGLDEGVKEGDPNQFQDLIKTSNDGLNGILTNIGVIGNGSGISVSTSKYLTTVSYNIINQTVISGGITNDLVEVSRNLIGVAREDDMEKRTKMIIGMCESILNKSRNYKVGEMSQKIPMIFDPWLGLMQRIVDDKNPLLEQLKRGRKNQQKAERVLLKVGQQVGKRGALFEQLAIQYNNQLKEINPMNAINMQAELLALNTRGSMINNSQIDPNNIVSWSKNRKAVETSTQQKAALERTKLAIHTQINLAHTDDMLADTSEKVLEAAVLNRAANEFGICAVGLTALAGMAEAVETYAIYTMYLTTHLLSFQRGSRENTTITLEQLKSLISEEKEKMSQFQGTLTGPYIIDTKANVQP